MIRIGIDPDTQKNGVAVLSDGKLQLFNLDLFDLLDLLLSTKPVDVVISAGWLNKHNYQAKSKFNSRVNSIIGERVGANHEIGKQIEKFCVKKNIPCKLIKPSSTKVDSKFFKSITGIEKSNQEQRDAAMLIVSYLK